MWGSLTGSRSRTCDANIENASTNQERVTRLSWRHDRDFLLCSVQPTVEHVPGTSRSSKPILIGFSRCPLTVPLVDCDDHGLSLLEDSKHDSFEAPSVVVLTTCHSPRRLIEAGACFEGYFRFVISFDGHTPFENEAITLRTSLDSHRTP